MENDASAPQGREEDRTDLISTFSDITSATKEEAIFFLESHNFDLDSAVSTFFEANTTLPIDTDHLSAPADRSPTVSPSNHSPTVSPSNHSPTVSPSRSRSRSSSPSPPVASQPNPYNLRSRQGPAPSPNQTDKKPSGSRAGGIRTLSDLNRHPDESGSESDKPQEYYTGGQKSGMLVQDPTKVNDVDSLFDQVRQAGAIEGSAGQLLPSASSSRIFQGTGRLLTGETLSSAPEPPEVITHQITFWSNGFTVDDGPLRMLDDHQNAPFLESIRKSECPKELEPADRKTAVHVSLTRRDENCPVQQKRQVSFQGVGRTLGGTPSESSVAVAAPPPSTVPTPTMGLVVDSALPSTSIQLRLADGTRMVSRFNHNHTVRDIRGFIDASRPGGPWAYQLQTVGFPPKQLTDLDQTIDQAGLANSVVIQKL